MFAKRHAAKMSFLTIIRDKNDKLYCSRIRDTHGNPKDTTYRMSISAN